MKKLLPPSLVLNILLLLIVIVQRQCQRDCPERPECPPAPDTVTVTNYSWDTVTIYKVVYKPEPYAEIDSIPYPVYIDSTESVTDYFRFRKYDIPLRDDSTCKLSLSADVWKNNLQRAELRGNVYNKQTIIEHTITVAEKKRFKAFVGVAPGFSMADTSVMISGVVGVLDKRDRLYIAKYEPFRKQYEIGLLWKIRFKR